MPDDQGARGHRASMTTRRAFLHSTLSLGLAFGLSGCLFGTPKHLKPLSEEAKALLASKGIAPGAPMFVRVFKQETQLEVWLQKPSGTYAHFKTYEICSWSGKLGPKLKQGDKQAPEGFYVVTPAQMNPWSKFHLSFNIGYPNEYDLSHKRTGKHLMVHGGCSSAGCYAVTDESVEEIFALAREAFSAGQRKFPVHAFPFRLSTENLAVYKGSRWHGFWRNLKQGYDFFEKHKRPPVVGVNNKRYVFFQTEDAVPAQFKVLAVGDGDPNHPRLISGWADQIPN